MGLGWFRVPWFYVVVFRMVKGGGVRTVCGLGFTMVWALGFWVLDGFGYRMV